MDPVFFLEADQKLKIFASAAKSIKVEPLSRAMFVKNLDSSTWRALAQGIQTPIGTSLSIKYRR